MKAVKRFTFVVLLLAVAVQSQSVPRQHWTVRKQWVRSHEMFLASDALRGRGSATEDEHIAAEYIAGQFAMLGLEPLAPENSYVEKIKLQQRRITGKPSIEARGQVLESDRDFVLLRSTGQSVSGPLQKITVAQADVATAKHGAVVLFTGELTDNNGRAVYAATYRVIGQGAVAVLRAEDPTSRHYYDEHKTSTPLLLEGTDVTGGIGRAAATVALLTPDALKRVAALNEAERVNVSVSSTVDARYTYNAMGVIRGTDPNTGAILLTAHLDHLGVGTPVDGDSIYNGASDDASGVTAVLELARAFGAWPRPKRTVMFVCFGSEELGGVGSSYFREHPPVPLTSIVANVEFETLGRQDKKLPPGTMFLTGWDRSNLGPTLAHHGALLANDPYPEEHFFERSDNFVLAKKGVVAQTAGSGPYPEYHRPNDDLAHLDLDFMTKAIQSLVAPMRWLANSDFKPKWNPGKKP